MATFEPHYSLAKHMGTHEVDWPVKTLKELIERGEKEYGQTFLDELKLATILVNGRAVNFLKGNKTPLTDADHVNSISLAAGG